jgi:hypothetical protein
MSISVHTSRITIYNSAWIYMLFDQVHDILSLTISNVVHCWQLCFPTYKTKNPSEFLSFKFIELLANFSLIYLTCFIEPQIRFDHSLIVLASQSFDELI